MLPQYIYCWRDIENQDALVAAYVLCMGGYQGVFGLSWGYHFFFNPADLDMSSMISGALGICFFADYLAFKIKKRSMFLQVCIAIDDSLKEALDAAWNTMSGNPQTGAIAEMMKPSDEVELTQVCHAAGEVQFHHENVVGKPTSS
eukprot:TRINITY_DN68072_c0_g1_i1.p1 TRINITY_DN68072_c0_g1~~TRINITY_DN68072_c0_g1_i1.p1  ORF type:complete len:145 (+),score=25.76 TRINITY_DN68072_c0_g1_i1:2-436(+)